MEALDCDLHERISYHWSSIVRGRYNVFSLMSLALFAVIILSLAAGVGLGYATIFGILNLFDRSRHFIKPSPAHILTTSSGSD
jgi:hypothetical protein